MKNLRNELDSIETTLSKLNERQRVHHLISTSSKIILLLAEHLFCTRPSLHLKRTFETRLYASQQNTQSRMVGLATVNGTERIWSENFY